MRGRSSTWGHEETSAKGLWHRDFHLRVVGCPFLDRLSSLSPSAPSQSVPSPSAPPPSPEECLPSYALDLDHETQGCVEGQGCQRRVMNQMHTGREKAIKYSISSFQAHIGLAWYLGVRGPRGGDLRKPGDRRRGENSLYSRYLREQIRIENRSLRSLGNQSNYKPFSGPRPCSPVSPWG